MLAAALERHTAAVEQRGRVAAALRRAVDMLVDAFTAGQRAEAALASARNEEGAWLATAILENREAGASPIKAAEAGLASVVEQRAAAARAEETLQAHAVEAESAVDWAQRRVREAAVAVLAASPQVTAVLERIEHLQRELMDAVDHLLWLLHHQVMTRKDGIGYDPNVDDLPTRCRRVAERLERPPIGWRDLISAKRGTADWQAAPAALEANADAPLPECV